MAFSVTDKAPGVYVEEVQVPGPIAGVGTSTAAFIGQAKQGPINTPKRFTNWSQFVGTFGDFITTGTVKVTHAVKAFFENGGANCYFVRVGTAVRASLKLNDQAAAPVPTIEVTSKAEGISGNTIKIEVKDTAVTPVNVTKAQITFPGIVPNAATPKEATTASALDAQKFNPGDTVLLEQGALKEQAIIASRTGMTVKFGSNLVNNFPAGATMRIADLASGEKKIRIDSLGSIQEGSYVGITAGPLKESAVVESVDPVNKFIIIEKGLTNLFKMSAADPVVTITPLEFDLIVTDSAGVTTAFNNLAMDMRHNRYFKKVVNSKAVDVDLVRPPSTTVPPDNRPAVLAPTTLAGGVDDNLSAIGVSHYKTGIDTLRVIDDVNVLCVPDRTDKGVQQYLIDHCEAMLDRFAVLDPTPDADPEAIQTQRNGLSSDRGYAAIYYPQVVIADPMGEGTLTIPPSGYIAGLYARVDTERGVHKAPANETLRGVVDIERNLADDEHGPLNEKGINVIRSQTGRGIRVMGARTIAPSDRTQWRFINVRRLLLYIEESLQEGTQFAVFEPNNTELWQALKRQVTDFLTRVWKDGALFGLTAEQAFRVRIDEELNPPDIRALGQLIIEVVVVPTTPAEYVVFRIISDTTGRSLVTE
jgi:uncharacterized protein